MSLKDVLMNDLKVAMKEKNTLKKGVLTLLRSEILNKEKEKGSSLSEQEEIAAVQKEVKQTIQTLTEAEKAGREEMVATTKEKISILESYLPKQLTEEEVRNLVSSLNLDPNKNMGQIMGIVMKKVAGRAPGQLVNKVIKEYLS